MSFGTLIPAADFAAAGRLYSCRRNKETGWMHLQGVVFRSGRRLAKSSIKAIDVAKMAEYPLKNTRVICGDDERRAGGVDPVF
jgi:hypothetical protein